MLHSNQDKLNCYSCAFSVVPTKWSSAVIVESNFKSMRCRRNAKTTVKTSIMMLTWIANVISQRETIISPMMTTTFNVMKIYIIRSTGECRCLMPTTGDATSIWSRYTCASTKGRSASAISLAMIEHNNAMDTVNRWMGRIPTIRHRRASSVFESRFPQ